MFVVIFFVVFWKNELWDLLACHLADFSPYNEILVLFKVRKNRKESGKTVVRIKCKPELRGLEILSIV